MTNWYYRPITESTQQAPPRSQPVRSWRSRLWGIFLVLALFCSCWCFASPAVAQSVEDLKNYHDLVQQQKQIIQKQHEQIQNLAKPAEDRLDALRNNLRATDSQIKENENKLKQAETKLGDLQGKLQNLELVLKRKQVATIARLRYLQRQQASQWWILLLSSRDLNQFADRRRQLSRVYDGDRELLGSLKQSTDSVEKQRNAVATQKNEIDLMQQRLAHQKANLQAETVAQTNVVKRLKSDRRSLELAEDRLEQDSRQITALILAKNQSSPGIMLVPGTGKMMYPVIGPVTSEFGWRTHPILGYEKFHSGIDFGVDYGTLIYAADSGTVIFSGWYGGYGNAVIIDHGNGVSTLYAHSSELYVSDGQSVQKGQPIATVGSTGFSTGPHLHFEVRASGEPTDPAAFL